MKQFLTCSLQDGRSALHVAAEKGHTIVVSVLISHGADVNTKDEVKNTCVSKFYL